MLPIRLLLVDDHQLLLDTWTYMLNLQPGIEVTGSTNTATGVMEMIETLQPDIVLTDIAMEPMNGVDLARIISKLMSGPKVIGVSFYAMPAYAKRMLAAGASGYVTKNSTRYELVDAIHEVYKGRRYICKEIKDNIMDMELGKTDAFNMLSQAEIDLILLLKKGMSSKDIALCKGLSYKTIEVHRYNMMKKVGANNVAELLNMAIARGL
jgi:DNA-binding NarL/FixJ family response regulator